MRLVAITGSIGCGKTTLANIIKELGYVVFDVDGWVRRIYYNKEFIKELKIIFPQVVDENFHVDKRAMRNIVFNNNPELKKLEGLIHPSLRSYLKKIKHKYAQNNQIYFLDVALLYEMGWEKYCDLVVVADVDYDIQKNRVMLRDNISGEDFDKINDVQISNEEKIKQADIVINTDKSMNLLKLNLITLITEIDNLL